MWPSSIGALNEECTNLSDPLQHPFRRSSRCDTGTCVEVSMGETIVVRNSTAPHQEVRFTKEEWLVFLAGVRLGEFEVS